MTLDENIERRGCQCGQRLGLDQPLAVPADNVCTKQRRSRHSLPCKLLSVFPEANARDQILGIFARSTTPDHFAISDWISFFISSGELPRTRLRRPFPGAA
jgi:hypothetical protein